MFKRIIFKIRFLLCKEKEPYFLFKEILGFLPHHIQYYQTALLHKSSSIRSKEGHLINNERLEFLGDSILQGIVSDVLYKQFEHKREGFLTNTRSKIVKRESLNELAHKIGLDTQVRSTGISTQEKTCIHGNALEALIGAIYLDQGYERCYRFVRDQVIAKYLPLDKLQYEETNFKSLVLEWGQKYHYNIQFEVQTENNESHKPTLFSTQIIVEGIKVGEGKEQTKKKSHQEAARQAYNRMKNEQGLLKAIKQSQQKRKEYEKNNLVHPISETETHTLNSD